MENEMCMYCGLEHDHSPSGCIAACGLMDFQGAQSSVRGYETVRGIELNASHFVPITQLLILTITLTVWTVNPRHGMRLEVPQPPVGLTHGAHDAEQYPEVENRGTYAGIRVSRPSMDGVVMGSLGLESRELAGAQKEQGQGKGEPEIATVRESIITQISKINFIFQLLKNKLYKTEVNKHLNQ